MSSAQDDSASTDHRPRSIAAQLSRYLGTESGSSGVLIAAVLAALVWTNISSASYESVWATTLSVGLGRGVVALELREWVSSGLMALFFLVVGLEARREFDLGSLRRRRDFILPAIACAMGMLLPVLIYLAMNASGGDVHGWGIAMSSDTALALGLLALIARQMPDRAKGFLLTLFIVDDLIALVVIAVGYSTGFEVVPFVISIAGFGAYLLIRRSPAIAPAAWTMAIVSWGAMLASGVDPLIVGLAVGLATGAYSPRRERLDDAAARFRRFREQPTFGLAREARDGMRNALSRNERMTSVFHPWSSYVIVPLFALANAGVVLDGPGLRYALSSPITLGIIVAYVVGKPVAIIATARIVTIVTRGRLSAPVGWASVSGIGTIGGVGFTVSLLIAGLALHGADLDAAKIGILGAIVGSTLTTGLLFRVVAALPPGPRARALQGEGEGITDLTQDVDEDRDHIRGPQDAAVTIVEYGDFECPYCGRAEPDLRALETMSDLSVRFVWRHLPLTEVHPHARLAAEASEAAAAQGCFWEMHDLLLVSQDRLGEGDLADHAARLGLDRDSFLRDLRRGAHRGRVRRDERSAELSGVAGTPTLFINGRRHYGAYDLDALRAAVLSAYEETLR